MFHTNLYLPISSKPVGCPLSVTRCKLTFTNFHHHKNSTQHQEKSCICQKGNSALITPYIVYQSFEFCARHPCFSKLCLFILVASFLVSTKPVTNWCTKLSKGTWALYIVDPENFPCSSYLSLGSYMSTFLTVKIPKQLNICC